jgi:hypothetical protein
MGFPRGDDVRLLKLSLEAFSPVELAPFWRSAKFPFCTSIVLISAIAGFDERDIKRLMLDEGIIRASRQDCGRGQQFATGEKIVEQDTAALYGVLVTQSRT